MTFYEIIKAGKHIKIEETDKKRNYDPADFWEENGRLYVRNDETPTVFFLLANGETVEEYEKAELINWLDKHDRLNNNELRLEIGMGLTI